MRVESTPGPSSAEKRLAQVLSAPVGSLEGRIVILRPAVPSDQAYLFSLESTGAGLRASRLRGLASPPQDSQDAGLEFVIQTRKSGRLVGCAGAYDISLRHGHARVGIILNPEFVRSGIGVEAGAILVAHLFSNLPLWKLYFEATDETIPHFGSALSMGLREEARLREHFFYDGVRHDLILLALYREAWESGGDPAARA